MCIYYLHYLNNSLLYIFCKHHLIHLYLDNPLNLLNINIYKFLLFFPRNYYFHRLIYNFLYILNTLLYRIIHNFLYMYNHHFHLDNIPQNIFYILYYFHHIEDIYLFLIYIYEHIHNLLYHLGYKCLYHILYIILLLDCIFHNNFDPKHR